MMAARNGSRHWMYPQDKRLHFRALNNYLEGAEEINDDDQAAGDNTYTSIPQSWSL